ncbi:MAG: hypothetical protein H6555_04955 [Lewinellaceae bacterium]|nr:hypothetical protein [Lewinellaceae bacterium]
MSLKKLLRYCFLVILLLLIVIPVVVLGPYVARVKHFAPDPAKGYHADFYLYLSPQAKKEAKAGKPITILVQPNNSGNSDDPAVHQKDAWWMGFGRHQLANELGVALLVPAFVRPAQDWHIYSHALDRDVFTTTRQDVGRPDLQLLAMIKEVQRSWAAEKLPFRKQILIQGYSASGMFANRFAALHPKDVLAVAAGSPGGWPISPLATYEGDSLPYPAGIADIQQLTGQPFDLDNYRRIPQLIVMGSLDENDSLDFTDGWEEQTAALVKKKFGPTPLARWPAAEEIYQDAGAQAHFQLVAGVGHDRRALQHLTTAFFKEVLQ